MIDECTRLIIQGDSLTDTQSYDLLSNIIQDDSISNEQITQLLMALHSKGETADEVYGFTTCLRNHMVPVPLPGPLIDVCGTGGSTHNRFNISTSVALLLGALEIPVAKHGNNGSKKANGSFDFLTELDIPFYSDVADIQRIFHSFRLAFIYAKWFHPAMKRVAAARQMMSTRSIFNLIGPLCNPAPITHQIIGTLTEGRAYLIADVLQRMGMTRAFVIVGNMIDEVSIADSTLILDVKGDSLSTFVVNPSDYQLLGPEPVGGLSQKNAEVFKQLIDVPDLNHSVLKSILLNTAVAAYCYSSDSSINDYVERAYDCLNSGAFSTYFYQYSTAKSVH